MTDGDAGAAEPQGSEPGELPELGEDNRLVLMAVDPYLVYAYWNLTSARIAAAQALFEEDEIEAHILRFHDTTGIDLDGTNCGTSFDVKIQLDARQWYVRLWSPERRYCADIGLRAKDGRLVALVRSNLVETPAAWPHLKVDEAAALVEQGEREAEMAVVTEAPATLPPAIAIEEKPEPPAAAHEGEPPAAAPPLPRFGSREVLARKLAEVAALRDEPIAPPPETDLTAICEKNFTAGISSVILGARRPGK